MAFTYANALTYASFKDNQATSTRDVSLRQRAVNDANRQFHGYGGRLFDFDRYFQQYLLPAAYMPATTTATVSATVGSGTLTGSGTAFTSSMVGWYFRINGTFETYICTAYSSATSITIQPYLGSTAGYQGTGGNVTGVSVAGTYSRILLPANFRTMDNAIVDYAFGYLDGSKTRDQISYLNMYSREVSQPRMFATDSDKNLTDATMRDYLWIYPPSSSARILRAYMYAWPTECTSNSDEFGINGNALPYEAEEVLRLFIDAYLLKNQGNPQWQSAFEIANKAADELQGDRGNSFPLQRQQWTPQGDTHAASNYAYPFGNVLNQASQ